MSAEEFEKLSLGPGEMVTTRAGAARAQTTASTSRQSSSSSSQSPSPSPDVIESNTGLRYNVTDLDVETRKRAELALGDNAIKMKYFNPLGEDSEECIFHIADDITVAIGGRFKIPKCTCGANEGGLACKHIFWLEDQLTTGAPDRVRAHLLRLKPDGSSIQQMEPSEMIKNISLEDIAEGLEWVLYDGSKIDIEDADERVAELLSVFEPSGTFPDEFKNMFETDNISQRSRKYKQFSDVIAKYAIDDLGLFARLQEIFDATFLAHTFIDRVNERTARTFQALDDYVGYGPRGAPVEACDVPTCAARLKDLVQRIREFYEEQVEDDPGSREIAVRAAGSLIAILEGVVERNRNVFERGTWAGLVPTDPSQTNLFARLIGAAPASESLFVLDVLNRFPQDDVLRAHWETLSAIAAKLEQNSTPPRYMSEFRVIHPESRKRSYPEAGGSSAKKPMK